MIDLEPTYEEPEQPVPVGTCEECGEDIMPWEDYYNFEDGTLTHDECVLDYIRKFKKYA